MCQWSSFGSHLELTPTRRYSCRWTERWAYNLQVTRIQPQSPARVLRGAARHGWIPASRPDERDVAGVPGGENDVFCAVRMCHGAINWCKLM